MKNHTFRQLLTLLNCPNCLGNLKKDQHSLRCCKCQNKWEINNGVICLLHHSHKIVRNELDGIEQLDREGGLDVFDNEYKQAYLNLPNFPDKGKFSHDENYFWEVAIGKKNFNKVKKSIGSGKIVLEIGADLCWASYQLARKNNFVIALDINSAHLQRANYLSRRSYFTKIQGDMINLPIRDESIDVVLGIASIHHSSNLNKTFREFARVLKSGGRLILLREPVRGEKTDEKNFGINEKKYGINEHAPTLKQWQEALKKAGFGFSAEIARLSFLTGKFKADKALRVVKRAFLALPLAGRYLAKHTITDYNFYAIKE